jgi:hypothetical protein
MLHFIARIIAEGPPPLGCITAKDMSPRGIEDMISVVLPQHVNRNLLSRAIQNPNVLVVAEAAQTNHARTGEIQPLVVKR